MSGHETSKVEELLYTNRAENVMATKVIIVPPDMKMSEVRRVMREKQVSGIPVVDNGGLIGMVSISDVIDALENGRMDTPVRDNMSKDVLTVLRETPVVDVVQQLGRKGYPRIPVLDGDGALVGLVTEGTLVRSLLKQMDRSYKKKEDEKIQTYRASHIFSDILSHDTSVSLRYVVHDKDFTEAGKASSMIKKSLQRLAVNPAMIRRVAVAVYEAEMNLVIHTLVGGQITVTARPNRVRISAVDHGPGIEDIGKVMQPGFSTAPEWIRDMGFGAGMGLANIKRCSDVMAITSAPGEGTRLDMIFLLEGFRPDPKY